MQLQNTRPIKPKLLEVIQTLTYAFVVILFYQNTAISDSKICSLLLQPKVKKAVFIGLSSKISNQLKVGSCKLHAECNYLELYLKSKNLIKSEQSISLYHMHFLAYWKLLIELLHDDPNMEEKALVISLRSLSEYASEFNNLFEDKGFYNREDYLISEKYN